MTNILLVLLSSFVCAAAFSELPVLPSPSPSVAGRSPARYRMRNPTLSAGPKPDLEELEPGVSDSNFGRMAYWDESYAPQSSESGPSEEPNVFSWYCGWEDELGPFFEELVPDKESLVLVPGIGNDVAIRDMFDVGGYQRLMAFDYAPQGVECARAMFGEDRLRTISERLGRGRQPPQTKDTERNGVLRVCDARDLSSEYGDNTFDAVLDKGTFDSIYLSGGKDKEKARANLSMAVAEMKRVVKEDTGIIFSVTAACVDAVREAFDSDEDWHQLRDGSMHITEDGYASNNVDATMLAWQLRRGSTGAAAT